MFAEDYCAQITSIYIDFFDRRLLSTDYTDLHRYTEDFVRRLNRFTQIFYTEDFGNII